MRLKTITDFGDLANVIASVGQVVRTVRSSLQKVMPSANNTLSEISTGLQGMMTDIGSVPGMSMNFESNGEEAERIFWPKHQSLLRPKWRRLFQIFQIPN